MTGSLEELDHVSRHAASALGYDLCGHTLQHQAVAQKEVQEYRDEVFLADCVKLPDPCPGRFFRVDLFIGSCAAFLKDGSFHYRIYFPFNFGPRPSFGNCSAHKKHIIYWIPSIITLLVCSTAFFTDIAFGFDENYAFYRGPLGYVAFAVPVLYIILSLWIIFRNFSERSSLERFIMPICAVFCLSSSLLDVLYGGVRTNEAIIISSIFFYLVLFSNDNRRDSLTGLLNRQAFYDDCNLYNRSIGAIASLDMNGLKLLNDTQGHQAGDKALTTIGSCMLKIADERTLAYRIGGDEFIIIFLHSDEKVITDVEKKITDSVTAAGYNISTGYAVRGDEDAVDDVVRKSDDRMYKAKADYYHSKGEEQRVAHYQCQE